MSKLGLKALSGSQCFYRCRVEKNNQNGTKMIRMIVCFKESDMSGLSLPNSMRNTIAGWLRLSSIFLGFAVVLTQPAYARSSQTDNATLELGRRIYMEGLSASGKPLQGQHPNSTNVEGADAACVKCHRRSGMGGLEGNIAAPPITGKFLFADKENRPVALLDNRSPKDVTRAHTPYNADKFAEAIREGRTIAGKKLNPLMPRYRLNQAEIKALIAYLTQLSSELPPGVENNKIRFAAIISADADPADRDVLVKMMTEAVKQRNASQLISAGRMRMPIDLIPRTPREWELSFWQLTGSPETWNKQLSDYYRNGPVFAVISGLSNSTWEPVGAFCEREKLPCLLPSLASPPADPGFYSVYFSRGVALEAGVVAKYLLEYEKKTPTRIVQIYRDEENGRIAAQALSRVLKNSTIKTEHRVLSGSEPEALSAALKELQPEDSVMLWLNPADLAMLGKAVPKPPEVSFYVSGFLAKDHFDSLSPAWRNGIRIVYPYELGEKRQKNLAQLKSWLKTWHIPLTGEALQSEIFFNLLLLTDLTSQMLDNLYRDYLLERTEDMLSAGTTSSAYPHLSLASGQRFASKGAYIARFNQNGVLSADSDWIIP